MCPYLLCRQLKTMAKKKHSFIPQSGKLTPRDKPVPIAYFGEPGTDLDEHVYRQIETAARLPVAVRAAVMPDGHSGFALPIGGVIGLENAVSPSFVGYDIACRVMLSVLDLPPAEFMQQRLKLANDMRAVTSFGLGSGFKGSQRRDHPVMDESLWQAIPVLRGHRSQAHEQLGSSGGGNHFFDALVGEVLHEADWMPFKQGERFVCLMTHSGSRGVGNKLAHHFVDVARRETSLIAAGIPKGYEWLPLDREAGQEYWQVMELMGRYAQANHALIHDHFLRRSGLTPLVRYENHHNFAFREQGMIIHRKGATPAYPGQTGLIPGTSGTPSYLVEGLGDPDALWSSSHGAGRPRSRTEAKSRHDEHAYQSHMRYHDILSFGVAPDETYMAYKDIQRVIDLQEGRLVRVIARLTPSVVIMGGRADDGD